MQPRLACRIHFLIQRAVAPCNHVYMSQLGKIIRPSFAEALRRIEWRMLARIPKKMYEESRFLQSLKEFAFPKRIYA